LRQLRHHVVGAANLEGAAGLEALALQPQRPSREARDVDQGRNLCDGLDPRPRCADVLEGDQFHLFCAVVVFARGGAFFTYLSSQLIVSSMVWRTDSRAA